MSWHANLCHVERHTTCKCPLCHLNTFVCYSDTLFEIYICRVLDTEFDLTHGWCLWKDQVIFFNMAHAAIKFNFELEEGFTFCVADMENKERKCNPWNSLCTNKLEKVVASARTTFKWHSSKKGQRLQDGAFKDWLSSRPLALRPIYWEISSDAYTPTSKWDSPESNWRQSAQGSESDEILGKCLTQEKKRGSHPIQAGL